MKFLKLTMLYSLMLTSPTTMAGESGFLYKGKEHITFRDGKKIGQSFAELSKEETRRVPASDSEVDPAGTDLVYFQRQGSLTCFIPANHAGLSCVRSQ